MLKNDKSSTHFQVKTVRTNSNLKRLFTGVEVALADPIAAATALEGDGSILFDDFVSSKFGVLPGFISGGETLERLSSELECWRRRSSI